MNIKRKLTTIKRKLLLANTHEYKKRFDGKTYRFIESCTASKVDKQRAFWSRNNTSVRTEKTTNGRYNIYIRN